MAISRGSQWFVASLALVLAGLAAGLYVLDGMLRDDVEPGRPVTFVVEPGESVRSVGDRLRDEGVVRSATRFRLAAQDADLAARLQPGEYELETGMDRDDVVQTLLAGPVGPAGIRFTVAEGLPVELTLARLADQIDHLDVDDLVAVLDERTEAGEDAEDLLRLPDWVPEPAAAADETEPYEGLLFPETYEVARDASALEVLQRMVDQLADVMDAVPAEDVEAAEERGLSRYEALIVASLVERESRVDDERAAVSGVVANRLEDGMPLQIDATVLYARGEHTDRVLLEDTGIDSPYNTYQVEGLPPTPIAGAGAASIRAAFAPADVTYRYYVLAAECDGTHAFADTLEEHNANVAELREVDGCR